MAKIIVWRNEFIYLYLNFEQELRIIDKLKDSSFKKIKEDLYKLHYISLKKLSQKNKMKEIVSILLGKNISFKY